MKSAETILAAIISTSLVGAYVYNDAYAPEHSTYGVYEEKWDDPTYVHIERDIITPVVIEALDVKISVCKSNVRCSKIAEALVYEARSESKEHQLKVASVILNRRDHTRFPDDVISVINQPYQFSYLMDMHKQTPPTQTAWQTAYDVAYTAYVEGVRNTKALFYYNPKAVVKTPLWAKVYTHIETDGAHKFYTY